MPAKKGAAKKGKSAPKKGGAKKSAPKPVEETKVEAPPVQAPVDNKLNPSNWIYWETWEDVISFDSPIMGQHNTQLHRISSIADAFNARYDIIVNAIKNTLIPKRTQLIAQITRVDYRIEEIKTVKGIIQRDVKNEYGGVMERLNSAEGVKLAILQYDIAEIQKDVNRIDGILQHLDELNGVAPPQPLPTAVSLVQPVGQGLDMVGFLLQFRKLQEDIDDLITKQFKVDIPVIPNDLPRELAEKRVKLEEYEKQKSLLKQKNEIILKLVEEMKVRENTIKDELGKQTLTLLDEYAVELKKFQLIWTFCGVHLDHIAVNLDWPKNPLIAEAEDFKPPTHFYSSIVPPKEFFATGRHFFVKPDDVDDAGVNESRLILNDEALQENPHASNAVKKIRAGYTYEKELELSEKLRNMAIDAAEREGRHIDDSTSINRRDFEYLLKSEFKLTGREVQNLMELIAPSFDNKINFKSFFRFLRKGENFEDSFKRNIEDDEQSAEAFENTLKRDESDQAFRNLKSSLNKESSLNQFPLKWNDYDREYLKEKLDYINIKSGYEGYISQDDLLLLFTKSEIVATNEEIKIFLNSIPKEATRISSYSGEKELQIDIDYLKRVFDIL